MNKQELIDKLKKQLTAPSEIDDTDFNKFYDLAINYAIYLAEQLDEPKRPVVPRYVADFYESIKDDFEDKVYGLCVEFYEDESELSTELYWWFKLDVNKPIETLVKMKLYGYEVEKEKLYTVEIPNPNNKYSKTYLCRDRFGEVELFNWSGYSSIKFADNWKQEENAQLTESEIKEDFEWAWQFAKEVDE